jgi:beta-phosphoglucomutase-like phosphatase (HAD superfamily)
VEQDKQSRPSWDPEFGTNLGPDRVPLQLNPGEQPVSWSLQPHGRFTPAIGPVSLPLAEYKGAILDLDGFLVNSEKPILQCILKGAKVLAREATGDQSYEFSVALVEEIKQRAFGKDDKNMTVALRAVLEERGLFPERCSKMEKEDFITHFREKRAEFFEAMIADGEFKELAGAIDFVKRLSAELDGKVAIFTGSPERNADLEISALGLDEYLPKQFRVYSTSLPAGRGKPEPDGFYMAREKLGLRDGDRWIGGGDRPNDYRAAIGSRDCGIFLGVPEDLDSNKYLKMVDDILNGAVQPSASPEKLRENILAGETKLVVTGGLGEDYIKFARSDR